MSLSPDPFRSGHGVGDVSLLLQTVRPQLAGPVGSLVPWKALQSNEGARKQQQPLNAPFLCTRMLCHMMYVWRQSHRQPFQRIILHQHVGIMPRKLDVRVRKSSLFAIHLSSFNSWMCWTQHELVFYGPSFRNSMLLWCVLNSEGGYAACVLKKQCSQNV